MKDTFKSLNLMFKDDQTITDLIHKIQNNQPIGR